MKYQFQRSFKLHSQESTWIVVTDGQGTHLFTWEGNGLKFVRNILPEITAEEERHARRLGRIYMNLNGTPCQITASPQSMMRRAQKLTQDLSAWINAEGKKEDSFRDLILVAPSSMLDNIYFKLFQDVRKRVIARIDKDAECYNHFSLEKEVARLLLF
jgi:protein required for attachment to host cells